MSEGLRKLAPSYRFRRSRRVPRGEGGHHGAARHHRRGPGQVLRPGPGARRRRHGGPAGNGVRAAGAERRGQDHGHPHPVHAVGSRRRHGHRWRVRCGPSTGGSAQADRPDRTVRRGRRDAVGFGEPLHDRAAPRHPCQERSRPRGRTARFLRSRRRREETREGLLGGHAAAAGPRRQLGRPPSVPVPGRTDDGPGSAQPPGVVDHDPQARCPGLDGAAHDAVPGGGRPSRRRSS